MNKFLFDMDGVLADWDKAFGNLHGSVGNHTEEEFKAIKKSLSESQFYMDLEPIEKGMNLFKMLAEFSDVAILTSAGKYNTEEVVKQKKAWLVKQLGYLPEFHYTKSSGEKAKFAQMGILIDDRLKSVSPFREAGGTAVLFSK